METDHLREFIILAEEKNYWQAAERLYMNQSTLSKHIKALEETLEVPLFRRTTRTVDLTGYGRVFLPYAQLLVRTEFDCVSALRLEKALQSKGVRINSIPTLAQYGLANLLVGFRNENLDYPLHVEESDSYSSRQALTQRKCELAFCWDIPPSLLPAKESAVVSHPLVQDRLVAVVSKSHPLAGRENVSLLDLKEEHFCFSKGFPFELARTNCQQLGFIPRVACQTDFLENIFDVLSNANHTALLMERYVRHAINASPQLADHFTILELVPAIHATLSLCYLRDVPLSPAGQRFLDFFNRWVDNHATKPDKKEP